MCLKTNFTPRSPGRSRLQIHTLKTPATAAACSRRWALTVFIWSPMRCICRARNVYSPLPALTWCLRRRDLRRFFGVTLLDFCRRRARCATAPFFHEIIGVTWYRLKSLPIDRNRIMKARIKWVENVGFVAESESGHAMVMDGAPEGGGRNLGPRPMETLLMGAGGCTAYDVVHILKKSRAAGHRLRGGNRRRTRQPKTRKCSPKFTSISSSPARRSSRSRSSARCICRRRNIARRRSCSPKQLPITHDFEIREA